MAERDDIQRDVRIIFHLLQQGLDGDAFPMGIELGPFGDTTDVDGWRLMGKSQQFLPGPPLWLFHIPFNREIPALQGGMRGRTSREDREPALEILSRRKPPGNVTFLATASDRPPYESFTHFVTSCSPFAFLVMFLIISCVFVTLLLVPPS